MPPLAEVQARVARAVLTGECAAAGPRLVGGGEPARRLAIHARHYATSLSAALRGKFPATAWLFGADLVAAAAHAYVRSRPPQKPCIAEYGADFPAFLARFEGARAFPYAEAFAALEWAVGRASIAVDAPPLPWSEIARAGADSLLDSGLLLQPGVEYRRSAWAVDELMKMYLAGFEAERFVLRDEDACVEVRGARGSLSLERLDAGTFAFRAALRAGRSIGDAASAALDCDEAFDAGTALQRLAHAGLATAIAAPPRGAGA